MGEKTIIVFDPTAKKRGKQAVLANRPSSLEGKRLVVIWNGKLAGDILLNRFAERLKERFRLAGIERIDHRADSFSGLDESEVNRLAKTFDEAIIGTGD